MNQRTTKVLTAGEAHTAKGLLEYTGMVWGGQGGFTSDFCKNLGS